MGARLEYSSLRQGLVGAWCPSLGASGLSLIDRSGRGNHGVLTNMGGQNNWQASDSGVAVSLDGSNDFISTSAPIVSNTVTIVVWAYFAATPLNFPMLLQWRQSGSANAVNTFALLHRPAGDTFGGGSGSRIMFSANGSVATTSFPSVPLTVQKWICYCGTFDGTTQRLFTNGVLNSSSGVSSAVSVVAQQRLVDIGNNRVSQADGFYNGFLDDMRLYSRALSLSEIKLLASRRGIGLTPLPDRAAGVPRKFRVRVGGVHEQADAYTKVGGVWQLSEASVNDAGVWK